MAEPIISKKCSKCKDFKPVSEFYKNRAQKDGYCNQCKICKNNTDRIYQQSPKGILIHRKAGLCYYKTEKGKIAYKRFQQSIKGRVVSKRTHKEYKKRHPERRKAKSAINNAVHCGKLPPIKTLQCSCGEQAKQYHHHKGYAPEHWLDVIPVCLKCHFS